MSERTKPPADIKAIFDNYSNGGTMTVDHLLRFLIEVQGEKSATEDDAEAIVNSLVAFQLPNISQSKALDLQAFFCYLFGDINPPLSPSASVISSFILFMEVFSLIIGSLCVKFVTNLDKNVLIFSFGFYFNLIQHGMMCCFHCWCSMR